MTVESLAPRDRSSHQLQVEVPGAPEQVWKAIAEEEWPGVAPEWLVEPRPGGTCVVRLRATAESERELARMLLHSVWLHRTSFAGERCSRISASATAAGPAARAWRDLAAALGIADAAVGERAIARAAGVPALVGVVERELRGDHHDGLALRLDGPAPGFVVLFAGSHGDAVRANVRGSLFGAGADAVAARCGAAWQAWLERRS
jgi:hypothetical protein